jgi:hypothetical protein
VPTPIGLTESAMMLEISLIKIENARLASMEMPSVVLSDVQVRRMCPVMEHLPTVQPLWDCACGVSLFSSTRPVVC